LVIDLSHIAHACSQQRQSNSPELWKTIMLNMILKNKNEFDPENVVIACDGAGCWRRDYYKEYKIKKKIRMSNDPDYASFKTELRTFVDELEEFIPWMILYNKECEADDIIATIINNNKDEEFVIVSRDKDFFQLHRDNVTQWDPIFKKYIKWEDGKTLYEHILSGDSADEVPNFLSDDDVFINEDKKQNILRKTFIQALKQKGFDKKQNKDGSFTYYVPTELTEWVQKQFKKNRQALTSHRLDQEVHKLCRNVDRNRRMIDLRYTPRALKIEILNQYNEKQNKLKNKTIEVLESYLYREGMVNNLSRSKLFFARN
jgi:5'-3' exonuclease